MMVKRHTWLVVAIAWVLSVACQAVRPGDATPPGAEDVGGIEATATREVAARATTVAPLDDALAEVLPTPIPPTPTLNPNRPTPTPEARIFEGEVEIGEVELAGSGLAAETVMIAASDGTMLAASYYPSTQDGAPTLLLLPMWGGDREVWRSFAIRAQEAGFAALALDLRGHGESGGARDVTAVEGDIVDAVTWLRDEKGATELVMVGAGASANLGATVFAQRDEIQGLALISPIREGQAEEIPGVDVANEAVGRAVFVAAAREDEAAMAPEAMPEASNVTVVTFEGAQHGTNLLQVENRLTEALLTWLAGVIGP